MLRAKGSLEESATSTRSGMRPLWHEIHAGGHHTHEVVRDVRVSAQAIERIAGRICRLCLFLYAVRMHATLSKHANVCALAAMLTTSGWVLRTQALQQAGHDSSLHGQ